MAINITGRSDVLAKRGMVATSQPLATQSGIRVLRKGGNAIDAAIAAAAVLDVVEPFSTGCGGDAFALVHLPGRNKPLSYNGSGRSGSLASLEDLFAMGWSEIPLLGGAPVTVPGAMHLWCHLIEKYGNLEMKEVLSDAIKYARDGFPVSPIISRSWSDIADRLQNQAARDIFLIHGRAPQIGETMRNQNLATTFENVASEGSDAFYTGDVASVIADTIQEHGGFVTAEDIESHVTISTSPISSEYRGLTVFEHPPNGQGFAALIMLNIMEEFDFGEFGPLDAMRFHLMIEAKKLAFSDLHQHNADPGLYKAPIARLLSKDYARKRAGLIEFEQASQIRESGIPIESDTVYLATADEDGCAVSFINSLYIGFGSGLVVPGTGIKLQNRGNLFSLDPEHPNCYAPGKLPFHTIIPGALYNEGTFYGVFGIMGGAHQAQAHAQFVSNLTDYEMNPQSAIDHPRFHHNHKENTVSLEMAIPDFVQFELLRLGHHLAEEPRSTYGGGQAILRLHDTWIAASDHRKDGMAAGF